mgnify:CR=1 FL=1
MRSGLNSIYISLSLGAVAVLIAGCSSSQPMVDSMYGNRNTIMTKPYELKIKPIIGSRQEDSKVVMDMGKIMKIWIAPYKNQGTLISSHDNYVVAQAPDFVVGENIPQKNWRSMKTPTNPIPFLFRDSDMDVKKKISEEDIVKFNNNVYAQENDVHVAKKRIEASNIYDKEIKDFLDK